jgi:hypothetical protein
MTDHYREKCVCGAEIDTEITPDTVDWVQIWVEKHRNCRQNIRIEPPRRPVDYPYVPQKPRPGEPWADRNRPFWDTYQPPSPCGPYTDAIPKADFDQLRSRIIENYAGPCV